MSSSRTVQSLVVLGATTSLLLPVSAVAASAQSDWLPQDLSSADRIGLVMDAGELRPDPAGPVQRRKSEAGLATFPEQSLEAETDTLDVRYQAEGGVLAEARGLRPDGMWTEWQAAPEESGRVSLPENVSRIQVRAEVEDALSELEVRPVEALDGSQTEHAAGDSEPFSARLFATRIGLVGNTTANGHTVRPSDHFVALPSRRGLATRDEGDYTVRVCSTGELGPDAEGDPAEHEPRCAYLPVWDVGPWNITDDHWNADRESWPDLDRGRPQAQAAYAEGYNDGLDGFGRQVANPAGIDLADGAFNDALQLSTNGWVQVDYLWTGEYRARAEVAADSYADPVAVREGPGTDHGSVGLAADKANVDVECRAAGEEVTGPLGTTDGWYRIGAGNYIPEAFADGGDDAPRC